MRWYATLTFFQCQTKVIPVPAILRISDTRMLRVSRKQREVWATSSCLPAIHHLQRWRGHFCRHYVSKVSVILGWTKPQFISLHMLSTLSPGYVTILRGRISPYLLWWGLVNISVWISTMAHKTRLVRELVTHYHIHHADPNRAMHVSTDEGSQSARLS